MMTLTVALVATLVGGVFALAGGFLQGQIATRQLRERFDHERRLAAEEHARAVVAEENQQLRQNIESQLNYGLRIGRAAARFRALVRFTDRPPIEVLADAYRFVELDHNLAPYPDWVHPDEIGDQTLRELLEDHRTIVHDLDGRLVFADKPDSPLPRDCMGVLSNIEEISRQVRVRMRELQRSGSPL